MTQPKSNNYIIADLHVDPILQYLLFRYEINQKHHEHWRPAKRRWLYDFLKALGKLNKFHRPFFNHIDLPRMQTGGYTFGAFGIHCWPRQTERNWPFILRQLDYFHTIVHQDENLVLAKRPEDINNAFQQGKVAAFPAVEGLHCLGKNGKATMKLRLNRLEQLRNRFHVGYLTLTHFSKNDAATPAMGLGCNDFAGLSEFGKEIVLKMNETGMIIDAAHVNNQGVLDACKISKKPVIISHTGLKAIRTHRRNISNEELQAVAGTGGIVGVMFATHFLSEAKKNLTSKIILEHIDYIVQTVGEDHAAIGSDFDGWISGIPYDMQDASDMPILIRGLVNLGYSNERIKKILGENFLRVWGNVLGV